MKCTGTAKNRRRRLNAFNEQGGLCWYCKKPMVIRVLVPGETVPPDTCTLEHLRPRGRPDRRPGEFKVNVAACYECNLAEGRKHAAELEKKGGLRLPLSALTSAGAPPERQGPQKKNPRAEARGS